MRHQLCKLEGMSRLCFCFFFQIGKKYTLLLFHRCKRSALLGHFPRWCSRRLTVIIICLFTWAFYKACGIKVLFLFRFSDLFTMKYLNNHWWFLSCKWYFLLKSRNKRIFTKHLSPPSEWPLPCDQTLPSYCSPSLLLSSLITASFLECPSFLRHRSPQYSRCAENSLSREHRPQTVGQHDLGDCRWHIDVPWHDILSQTEKTIPFQFSFLAFLISYKGKSLCFGTIMPLPHL